MRFEDQLAQVLPDDLPHRTDVIARTARHLELIAEANQVLNLTRITGTREAAIKHVLDSVLPWRHFAGARTVLDAGTGAGLPGLPLALVLPETQFTLAESIQKKARFVQSAVEQLGLPNVRVLPQRAEDVLRATPMQWVTARAVAPLSRAIGLFGAAVKSGSKVLLYKGPDVEEEIEEAAAEARKRQIQIQVVDRYDLPEGFGTRTLVQLNR